MSSMMDVKVESTPIDQARVVIDLGQGHVLSIRVTYVKDRYRTVHINWTVPPHVTGPSTEVRDRCNVNLLATALDLSKGKLATVKEARAI